MWRRTGFPRQVERLSDRVNARPRRRKRPAPRDERPAGPKLVRGRGCCRPRRYRGNPASLVVYVLLAAGLTALLLKYYVVPLLGG